MGEARGHICWSPWMRRISRAIPPDPRCKLCDTPFGPPGKVMRFIGFGPSRLNRRCRGRRRDLVSSAAAEAAGMETVGLESRTLELRGRKKSVDAWVATSGQELVGA